jgi:hypothetical protein
VLLLKGASIALRYYPDPATRPIGDLDVLVRHRDAPRAAAALAAAGWTPAKRTPVEELQGYAHGVSFRRGAASLDLHWNALWAKRSADADGPLWDAAESIDFRGRKAWALSPSDELAHVCLHGARRSQNAYSWQPNPLVRWVTDAAWILRAREIDWQRVAATVARYHARLQALDALSYLSTGPLLPVPVELLEAWAAVRSPADRLHYDLALTPRPPALFPLLPRFRFWSSYRMKLYHERGANGVDDMGFAARAAGFPSYLNAFLKGDLDAGRLRALPSRLARKLLRRPSLLRLGPERLANVSRRRPAGGR